MAGLLLWMTALTAARGQYDIRQIADERMINRQPVISDTGLVAWYAFGRAVTDLTATDIYVYTNGITQNISRGVTEVHAGNNDPQVSSNSVVWVTTVTDTSGDLSWVLVDPPWREGEPEEIDARWEAFADRDGAGGSLGRQWFEHMTNLTFGTNTEVDIRTPRRRPSGLNEIMYWNAQEGITRITQDTRNDLGPGFWGKIISWQKARGWPFGWEIMIWADGQRMQMTTNYYYNMAPRVHNHQVVWYGWDGNDYEIFLYDHNQGEITQITSNNYDCVSPQIWDGVVIWEGYQSISSDIFMWKDGVITKLSDNIEDDINARVWNGQVVWQGFDGNDFEIFYYDGSQTIRLTNNNYDDINPDIRDGVITWMGYADNMDAEIFVWTGGADPIRLTENDAEDRNPRTAGGRIVWQSVEEGKSLIYLAEPR